MILLIGLNAWVVWHAFGTGSTGQMQAMHGFWMAIARLADGHWYAPSWWPYWNGGQPFEFTYAPLVPWLVAQVARIGGVELGQALNIVSAAVYCLGPVAAYLLAWQWTGRAGWSFLAGVVYSLAAPSELLVPDGQFALAHLGDARRLYLGFVWDETPHQLALALAAVAGALLARAMENRGGIALTGVAVAAALAVWANTFGAPVMAIIALSLVAAYPAGAWRARAVVAVRAGLLAYALACGFLPPSLLAVLRDNAALFAESAWSNRSWLGLAVVVAGGVVLAYAGRRLPRGLAVLVLLAWISTMIPVLHQYGDIHFLPQPGRYKVEMELALALAGVFAVAGVAGRLPRGVRIAGALALVWPFWLQLDAHRRFSRQEIRPRDLTGTIEYEVAQWAGQNLKGQTVLAAGSIGQWMNLWSDTRQFGGGAYPSALNPVQQRVLWDLFPGVADAEECFRLRLAWWKAFGVDAVVVPGRQSPEFWKPFPDPERFAGRLELLWKHRDTAVYRVGRARHSQAHAIPRSAVVSATPRNISETEPIAAYVAALEAAGAPLLTLDWQGTGRGVIRGMPRPGEVISVQMNYHPGWKAVSGGGEAPIRRDGLGQIIIEPQGSDQVELVYDGGAEARLCRAVSAVSWLAMPWMVWRRVRRKKK